MSVVGEEIERLAKKIQAKGVTHDQDETKEQEYFTKQMSDLKNSLNLVVDRAVDKLKERHAASVNPYWNSETRLNHLALKLNEIRDFYEEADEEKKEQLLGELHTLEAQIDRIKADPNFTERLTVKLD